MEDGEAVLAGGGQGMGAGRNGGGGTGDAPVSYTHLKRSVKYKAVDVHYHDPATSIVEAVMSRGGREVADWVEACL